ncbi:MAG: AbrB/MazE/SpoVT family DNA-binding domain-containing protein [Moorella sp. (in: Bacteria)]|nr:AbrB/MazE/SpoVT family DNA-binding domain-containing protein [Moorella sp. (in: firmicutes)]
MSLGKMSTRGQVVIPKSLRNKLGLKPNTVILFEEMQGKLLLTPIPDDPIQAARGILKTSRTAEELMREYRREELKLESKKG